MRKIRVGIVNYLNTKPLLYGLEKPPIVEDIELIKDYPSRIAGMLLNNEIDVGLVPVAVLSALDSYYLVGDYCIGTEGEIASVALFSDVPMDKIRTVLLDYQSKTSVALLKYLIRNYWKIDPEIIETKNEDYRKEIKGTTAGLVIGDRAFEQRKISTYVYDLGSAWKAITGLPFVFAVWVSKKQLDEAFISSFNDANAAGFNHLDELVADQPLTSIDLKKYYTRHLSYRLDEQKRKAMKHFLSLLPTI